MPLTFYKQNKWQIEEGSKNVQKEYFDQILDRQV